MAGNVDDARAPPVREGHPSEAQLDRDAAILLLLKAVGILPGEGFDERSLAVIDMTGGADNRVDDLGSHYWVRAEKSGAPDRLRQDCRSLLFQLVGVHLEVEVVAPTFDFAIVGDFKD